MMLTTLTASSAVDFLGVYFPGVHFPDVIVLHLLTSSAVWFPHVVVLAFVVTYQCRLGEVVHGCHSRGCYVVSWLPCTR
jgi:hypothetical protein